MTPADTPAPAPACDLFVPNATMLDGRKVSLVVANGRITRVLRAGEPLPAEVAQARETLEGEGMLVAPGLRNAHTHAGMTLFRGFADDMPLMEWLEQKIWPAEKKLTPEAVYWGTKLACYEMIRTGTVWFADMYWHLSEIARAVQDTGMRALLGAVFVKFLPHDQFALAEEQIALWRGGAFGPLVDLALAPHAPYSVEPEAMERLVELAVAHELPIHTHLSENEWEIAAAAEAHGVGVRPAHALEKMGLFRAPALMLAHGVWLDESELELIASHNGATVLHCPSANMKLAVGGATGRAFPYAAAKAAGTRIAIGTDGPCSNNRLDLFSDLRLASLLAKHTTGDPTAFPAADALASATRTIAEGLGQPGGTLEVGAPADFILLPLDEPALTPSFDFTSHLVYAINGAAVDSTVIAGRVVMHHRNQPGYAEARTKVEEIVTQLGYRG